MSSTKVTHDSASASQHHRPFTTDDAFTAYRHFTPLALALPPERVVRRRAFDADVARANVALAMETLRPIEAELRRDFPNCPIDDLLEEPALVLAVGYAAGRVARPAGASKALLLELLPLRKRALAALEGLADAGAVPAERVRAIRAGHGALDAAHDAIAIAAVFREYQAEVAGRHPLSKELLAELEARGNQLLPILRSSSAPRRRAEVGEAVDLRDRLVTLLAERHDTLRRVVAMHHGLDKVVRLVPGLGNRLRRKAQAPVPVPVPVIAPPGANAEASPLGSAAEPASTHLLAPTRAAG